jgi:hypothetical protein
MDIRFLMQSTVLTNIWCLVIVGRCTASARASAPVNATEVIASFVNVLAGVMVDALYPAQQEDDQSDEENSSKNAADVHKNLRWYV